MTFHLVSPVSFEPWDWRSSVEKGIGGCETSVTLMSAGLAARGHEVHCYNELPADCTHHWKGTHWHPMEEVDYDMPGVFVLYRCPDKIDEFDLGRTDQVRWLLCQDWDYPSWTPERVAGCDRIIPMCRSHANWLFQRHPEFAGKIWVTRNGIRNDLIAETEAAGLPDRNPRRIMFASSPDRGLLACLKVFRRVKEFVPDAEFHATYGFNNIDKLIANGATSFVKYKAECMKLVEETGAVFHGRLTQNQLYREWLKTGILLYPTTFWETGWITGLEGQALGAVPVFSPIWAQIENTQWGVPVAGDPEDPLTLARFAAECVRLMLNPPADDFRRSMMSDVRGKWDWSQFVYAKPGENWEDAARDDMEAKRGLLAA